MLATNRFPAAVTKTAAMRKSLLERKDFMQLADSKTVQDVYEYLNKNTQYAKVLSKLQGRKIHRGDMEVALQKYRVQQSVKTHTFLNYEYGNLLKAYLKEFEILDIITLIDGTKNNLDPLLIENYIVSDPSFATLDFHALAQETSIESLMKRLEGTDYHILIEPYINEPSEKFGFYLDMSLERYFYDQLMKQAVAVEKEHHDEIISLLRKKVDLLNLSFLYRGLKYYDISKEELVNFALNHGYRYRYEDLRQLAYNRKPEDFPDLFQNTEYAFLFKKEEESDLYMERRILRFLYYQNLRLSRTGSDFTKILGYLFMVEYEVEDITTIIEAKRYHLDKDKIGRYLIRSLEGDENFGG